VPRCEDWASIHFPLIKNRDCYAPRWFGHKGLFPLGCQDLNLFRFSCGKSVTFHRFFSSLLLCGFYSYWFTLLNRAFRCIFTSCLSIKGRLLFRLLILEMNVQLTRSRNGAFCQRTYKKVPQHESVPASAIPGLGILPPHRREGIILLSTTPEDWLLRNEWAIRNG